MEAQQAGAEPDGRQGGSGGPGLPALGYGQRLLVWGWREIVTTGQAGPLLLREFGAACGEDAGEVLATFSAFLQTIACGSRRRLLIGHPGCTGLTADERQLLAIVAAAQAEEPARLDAHLCWLTRAPLRPTVTLVTRALATALSVHGLCAPMLR